jgi:hypothetical protein
MEEATTMPSEPRFTRRTLTRTGLGLAALATIGGVPVSTSAAPKTKSTEVGEMPTTGGLRPGPIGPNPAPAVSRRARPVTLTIDAIGVNAQIETTEIVDGVMQDPTGPWVVSWYKETARPGEDGNIVMSGHVDYRDVGPAVFYSINTLRRARRSRSPATTTDLRLPGPEREPLRRGQRAGQRDRRRDRDPAVTLITCGGPFDYQTGEYLQRTVVRGRFDRVESDEA